METIKGTPNHLIDMPKIDKILLKMGISPSLKGYWYLRELIAATVSCNGDISRKVTRWMTQLASSRKVNYHQVERCVRHAVESSVNRIDADTFEELYGNIIFSNKGKPTNKEFLGAAYLLYIRGGE